MNTKGGQTSLKQVDVSQLLKLQELFHFHFLTDELLNQMINFYVRLVDQVEQRQSPIRQYFMQKIRFVLSCPEVIKNLDKKAQKVHQGNQNSEQTSLQQYEVGKTAEIARNQAVQEQFSSGQNRRKIPGELGEKQKNLKIEMQLKIMKEVQENANKLQEKYQQQVKKQEQAITKAVTRQDQALNQRRANRKRKLRKKSADLNQKQIVSVEMPSPIPIAQLITIQKEVKETFERFTRLTQNKIDKGNNNIKENKGRVKIQIKQQEYQEQEEFQLIDNKQEKLKEEPPISPANPTRDTTFVEYKTFDQSKKGRVTVRNKQYEQIVEDDQF